MIAAERLAQIEAEANAATEGPWRPCAVENCTCGLIWSIPMDRIVANTRDDEEERPGHAANSTFIANARQNIPDLIAEVRRLQAERAAVRAAFVQPGTEPITEDMGKLARIVVEQLSEEVARVERIDQESAAAIERTSNAIIADKWNATAEWQARALKAEKESARHLTMATDYQALAAHREGENDALKAEIARMNVLLNASVQTSARLQQDLEDARRIYREDMGRDEDDFDEDSSADPSWGGGHIPDEPERLPSGPVQAIRVDPEDPHAIYTFAAGTILHIHDGLQPVTCVMQPMGAEVPLDTPLVVLQRVFGESSWTVLRAEDGRLFTHPEFVNVELGEWTMRVSPEGRASAFVMGCATLAALNELKARAPWL